MTISDKLGEIMDFLTGGINREEEGALTDWDDEEYYEEDGSALRKIERAPKIENLRDRESKVVNHPNYKGYEVMVVEPRSFGEAGKIVQHLKDKKTVVLNLHLLEKVQSQRTIDFVCGASHALAGTVQKVGETVFIFTPNTVALSVDSQAQSKFAESLWNKPL